MQDLVTNLGSLRNATETRKGIFCSLKTAGNPFGGRNQAIGNRACFLEVELALESDLIEIKALVDQTLSDIKNF